MVHRLFYTTALALTLSGAVLVGTASAQDTTTDPAVQPSTNEQSTDPAAQAPADESTDPAAQAPADDTTAAPADGTTDTMDATTTEEAVSPPPADAVIEAQEPSQDRADQLIGMTVMGGNGEKIGSAEDLLIDDKKEVTGVVISVGGFLGIGSKSVAINWDEVEVRDNPDSGATEMVVNWSKEQLEAAPAFKTTEEQEAEAASQQSTTPPASTGTTTTE
jgi:sporulation protein YlmC with PRC-barrel domain